jgi:hypothetical protein
MVLGAFFLLCPQYLLAAELLFKAAPDQRTIEVWVDPQSKELNVVEGTIKFSGPATDGLIVQVENGHSILPIWPTPPLYNENDKAIEFVGGVPGGFSNEGLIFKLIISPTTFGDLEIEYVDGAGYLNDGAGTKEEIASQKFVVTLNEAEADRSNNDSSRSHTFAYVIIILLVIGGGVVIFKYVFKKRYA